MNVIYFLITMFALPLLVYFCVKFGTVAFYKAKQFIEKEKNSNLFKERNNANGKEQKKET